ncbi:hypothetical protein [uncultured Roseivirga sp.]|uniref:hypothetical protein n=1 Tax=uncultured Roseivirga sp. TaxID=543088 RepID=UPI000D78FB39|nr:hypothetical protein [uncultured Roseivirga sp.]PWL31140.1 MAG: hypothetical protein DCO95_06610 [Roseivirga sp. XM-24bin3]
MRREQKPRRFGYFLAEIFILILGISASFALNEWRVSKQESSQETELLLNFKQNLRVDSLALHEGMKQLKLQVENAQKLLMSDETLVIDSLANYSISLLNYVPFNTNDITYQQMKSSGRIGIIENDSLANRLVGLYESSFELVTTWTLIDAEHVRQKLIPFVEENFPFAIGLRYSQSDNFVKRELAKQIKSDQFKHLVQFGLSYKASTAVIVESVLEEIRETIAMIDSELPSSQTVYGRESTSQGQ